MTKSDDEDLAELIAGLAGQSVWTPRLGVGTFLTLNLGKPVAGDPSHGEWHLWAYQCDWRILDGDVLVGGSGDERAVMQEAVQRLDGLVVRSARLSAPNDLLLSLTAGIDLQLLPTAAGAGDNWMLWLPDGQVLTAQHDGTLVSESRSAAAQTDPSPGALS